VALGSLALILFVVSCGKLRRGAGEPPALVIFKNEAFYEATVYVVQLGGESRRIGTVSSGRTETLRAPSDLIRGSVAIVARLLAQDYRPSTGRVDMNAGVAYEVTLSSDGRYLAFLPAREP
jgi:hypothetical protein